MNGLLKDDFETEDLEPVTEMDLNEETHPPTTQDSFRETAGEPVQFISENNEAGEEPNDPKIKSEFQKDRSSGMPQAPIAPQKAAKSGVATSQGFNLPSRSTGQISSQTLPAKLEKHYAQILVKAEGLGKSIINYINKRQEASDAFLKYQEDFILTAEQLTSIPHEDVRLALDQGNPGLVNEEHIPNYFEAIKNMGKIEENEIAYKNKRSIAEQARREVLQKALVVENDWKSFEQEQNEIKGLYPGNVLKKPPDPLKNAQRIASEPNLVSAPEITGAATPEQLLELQMKGAEATLAQNFAENYQRPAAPLSGVIRGREEVKREAEKTQEGSETGEGGSEGGTDSGRQDSDQQGGRDGDRTNSGAKPRLGRHKVSSIPTA